MPSTVRFSQFNASLNRNSAGQLVADLSTPNNAQAKAVAEIIQRINPDVLLINEFDYVPSDPLQPVRLLQQNYLSISQNGANPVNFPYVYIAPSNTGIATGFDLNNNGQAVTTPETPGYGDDAFGFGNFPGQFGMLLLSKYPIDTANVRTFQEFLWKDMPGNLLMNDPTIDNPATPANENLSGFYSLEEQAILRLSSKSHWDVPILIDGEVVHALVSHPTPPVFDGTEDRNGKRNHDEIRFWSDYVTSGQGDYIYDDNGNFGGLAAGSNFVIMGDQNADPNDGDSYDFAIRQLLQNPHINTNFIPTSSGGSQQSALQGGANATHSSSPAFDTADFADTTPGNLRSDYVLPSVNLEIANSGIFWPLNTDPTFAPVGVFNPALPGGFPSSDHRAVYVDLQLGAPEAGQTVVDTNLGGQQIFSTSTIANLNGINTQIGGLSGVSYDPATNRYYFISDDRGDRTAANSTASPPPGDNTPPRFYTADISFSANGTPTVTFTGVTLLRDENGNTFAPLKLDPEDIVLTGRGTAFISSEGEVNISAGRVTNPFVNEFDLTTGRQVRALPVPTKFLPVVQDTNGDGVINTGDTQTSGIRNNLAFESLTITPNQRYLYTATENALFQDGPTSAVGVGSPARIIQYNLVTGQPEKEYLYNVDPVAENPNPATAFATNGLVDLLAIDDRGTFLALERSFSTGVPGTGNTIKIYEISLQGATDISNINALGSLSASDLAAIAPVQKRLVLNLNDLNLPTGTDNIEGIEFGPTQADGSRSIVLVSDNNFSATQFTQILTLSADLVPSVAPALETRANLDDPNKPFSDRADSDDPAIYVNTHDAAASLVLTTVKNGGLQVYDLNGRLLQSVNPGNIRYNNVDILYNFELGGETTDIAIVSDRNNDKLVIFKINSDPTTPGQYVEDITSSAIGTIFQASPFEPPYSASTRSAYGITGYRSPVSGEYYVFVNRRETGDVAQYRLFDAGDGTVNADRVRSLTVPIPPGAPANTDPQLEGMVVDQETGYLYIGQENVGIWKYLAEPNSSNTGVLIDRVKSLGGSILEDDVEGLTIYYGPDGKGYLLASSQGNNTFAVYSRSGNNEYLGRFAVGSSGSIDSVQESDGADVINVPLGPNYPFGLFVTQDGFNDPAVLVNDEGELENISTNFKFVPWQNIANSFANPLLIDTFSYNPRNPNPSSLINGIASGDTTQTSTVLWANSTFAGAVTFEYSFSPNFSTIEGIVTGNVANALVPAKVELTGLDPDSDYYYRVTDAAGATAIGHFRTAAEIGTYTGLRFGATGDWRGEIAPYPAIANVASLSPDFLIELGDTIYADVASPGLLNPDGTRKAQAETLDDFRAKHAEVYGVRYGQNYWADVRASTSVLSVIDDHEVTNDFAGGAPASSDPRFNNNSSQLINDTALYENGLQAFQEYNPIQDQFYGETGDLRTAGERKLYRYNTYGSDAATFILDARSFRDPELSGVANPNDPSQVGAFLAQSFNPNRTLLGRQQVHDLKHDLLAAEEAGIIWKFVVVPEPIQNLGIVGASDRFEGYAAERTEILKFIDDNKIDNVVFISADIHGTLVNNLTYQLAPGQAQIATSAFEITTGSVGYDAPFGPTVAELAGAAGLLTPEQRAFYNALPVAYDADSLPNDKDDFIKQIVDAGLTPLGYDPIGLNNNLAIAAGKINATLLQGDYVATHTYGWTMFDINPDTQKLTVTTYGIPYYTEEQLLANPTAITSLTPQIVSQFEVTPTFSNPVAGAAGAGFGRYGSELLTANSFQSNQLATLGLAQPSLG